MSELNRQHLIRTLDKLSGIDEITHRAMMGGYIIYYKQKVIGGIYGGRFMLKMTKSSEALMSDVIPEPPYEGARDMLPADNKDSELLKKVIEAMYDELPFTKKRK